MSDGLLTRLRWSSSIGGESVPRRRFGPTSFGEKGIVLGYSYGGLRNECGIAFEVNEGPGMITMPLHCDLCGKELGAVPSDHQRAKEGIYIRAQRAAIAEALVRVRRVAGIGRVRSWVEGHSSPPLPRSSSALSIALSRVETTPLSIARSSEVILVKLDGWTVRFRMSLTACSE